MNYCYKIAEIVLSLDSSILLVIHGDKYVTCILVFTHDFNIEVHLVSSGGWSPAHCIIVARPYLCRIAFFMFKEVSSQSTTTAKFLDKKPPLQYVS